MQPALFTKIEIDAFFRKHQLKWGRTWRRRRKKNKLNVTRVWPLLSLKYYSVYALLKPAASIKISLFYATMIILNPLLNNFLALLIRKQSKMSKLTIRSINV